MRYLNFMQKLGNWGMMPRIAFIAATLAMLIGAACGSADDTSPKSPIDVSEAPALFEHDVRNAFANSYRVRYALTIEIDGETHECTIEWWKNGTTEERIDMCAPLVYNDGGSELWRILKDGDRTLVCSSRLPRTPDGELDSGDGGACHDDSFGIGDAAGNALVYTGFVLDYPDALPPDYFDGLEDFHFDKAWNTTIAGRDSRCYTIAASSSSHPASERCYTTDGVPVSRSGSEWFTYKLKATDVGVVSPADFDPPYPYVKVESD